MQEEVPVLDLLPAWEEEAEDDQGAHQDTHQDASMYDWCQMSSYRKIPNSRFWVLLLQGQSH